MNRTAYLTAIGALCAAGFTPVYATDSAENDALAINTAKITLTQAVSAVEKRVGNRASPAEYQHNKGRWE